MVYRDIQYWGLLTYFAVCNNTHRTCNTLHKKMHRVPSISLFNSWYNSQHHAPCILNVAQIISIVQSTWTLTWLLLRKKLFQRSVICLIKENIQLRLISRISTSILHHRPITNFWHGYKLVSREPNTLFTAAKHSATSATYIKESSADYLYHHNMTCFNSPLLTKYFQF